MLPEPERFPEVDRVAVWKNYGLQPWRADGYPADTSDQAVLGYWYEWARIYEMALNDADLYLTQLTDKERDARRQQALQKLLDRMDAAQQYIDEQDSGAYSGFSGFSTATRQAAGGGKGKDDDDEYWPGAGDPDYSV